MCIGSKSWKSPNIMNMVLKVAGVSIVFVHSNPLSNVHKTKDSESRAIPPF